MNISAPFIHRPIATSLLMLGILVFGIGAYGLLPVAALPNVDFPTIVVSVNYPGASPDTMASAVATPLEQQFASIPSLAQMTSTSGIGSLSITLQFDLERNIDAAASDVQQAINAASGPVAERFAVAADLSKNQSGRSAGADLCGLSDALPIYRVDDFAYTILAQKLSTVPGVSEARIFGQQPYSVHVQIDPGALAARGIGFEDVRAALVAATVDRPKGVLEGDAPDLYARHQRPALQRRPVRQRHRRLSQRRAGAHQGCRQRDRHQAERADRRLVLRQAGRGSGDPASGRRQHQRAGRHASRR